MRLAAVGLGVAALVIVGRVAAQPAAAPEGNATCPAEATPAGTPCTLPHAPDPASSDLTPTQWLFGHDLNAKLTRPSAMVPLLASASSSGSATVAARADNALPVAASKVPSNTTTRGAARDAAEMQLPPWARSLTPQQFLIEEWRHSEISVADSLYHDALMRITSTFDSAQRLRIDDAGRTRILRHLDALLDVTNYNWAMFRFQIKRRADSAWAALKAGD